MARIGAATLRFGALGYVRVSLSGRNNASLLAALAVALFWAVENTDVNGPQLERVAIIVSAVVLGWIALRGSRFAAPLTCTLAVVVAISERLRREPVIGGSDVLPATSEAIHVAASGGNPYAACLQSTVPPCSPFVYPPGELLWYAIPQAIVGDIARVDTWAGVLVVAAIAIVGVRVGFAAAALPAMLYAGWGTAGYRTVDGSNDVSASALVVLACVALAFAIPRITAPTSPWPDRALIVSAVLFGWAIAFKQFAILILPPIARWLAVSGATWRRYVVIAIGVAATFIAPFFVRDPLAFINAQINALSFHQDIWGTNLLHAFAQYGDPSGLVVPHKRIKDWLRE